MTPKSRAIRDSLGALTLLATALGVSLLVAQLLLAPPAKDLRALAVYLVAAGATSLAVGAWLFRWSSRRGKLGLRGMITLGACVGAAAGLVNIFVVARLMFVSTAHDLRLLIALILSSAILSAGFSAWIAQQLSSRIHVITSTIAALARGDYQRMAPRGGSNELDQLANDVNALAVRLRAAEKERESIEEQRRDLTIAISHDLRTPLASMRAMIEALADGLVEDPAEASRYYRSLTADIERLTRMVNDLYQLAQIDSGALRLDREQVAIHEIAAEVVDAVQAQAQRRGIHLTFFGENSLGTLAVDGLLIERAIRNLVSNALEHTPPGGNVRVLVTAESHDVAVAVQDDGEGIEPDDLPRVWDRFFRAKRSRGKTSETSDGVGLGLPIVRGIVAAHGGTVSAESEPGRGSSFLIRLPRRPTGV